MKDIWYADNRDLVKWAVLLNLAADYDLAAVVQVGFLRPGSQGPRLLCDDKEVPFPTAVWQHFRTPGRVTALTAGRKPEIIVIEDIFDPNNRGLYVSRALATISQLKHNPKAVLLDPDTGIAPSVPKAEHVTPEEIRAFWSALLPGDWLVVYQHASRVPHWRDAGRARFANVVASAAVTTFRSPDVALDVAFYAAQKTP
jgi:hypothetical protein